MLTALLALAYGGFIYLLLPAEVTTLGDDFGYYRSIIETLQHHRPWTDAWLEPWAASLSVMAAAIFRVSGSFHLATYGLQSVLAALAFGCLCHLLRRRGHAWPVAALLAGLFLTAPTVLWKQLEFTGIVLYWPCLLTALMAAEGRRWGWFTVAWVLALWTRQSALAWGVIPAWEILQAWRRGSAGADWRRPLWAGVAGVAAFGLASVLMNKTHAQALITDHVFEQLDPWRMARYAATGLLVYAVAAGVGACGLAFGPGPLRTGRGWLALLAGLAVVASFAALRWDPRLLVAVEQACYEGQPGRYLFPALLVAAIVGWLSVRVAFQPRMLVYAAASLALVSLRKDHLWDYYLGDVLIIALLSVGASTAQPTPAAPGKAMRGFLRAAVAALLLGFIAFNGWAVLQLKLRLDRAHATNHLCEQALRRGELQPHQLYGASFGFVAWHLYPYYIAHEGRTERKIAGFWNYLVYSIDIRTVYHGWPGRISPFKDEYPPEAAKLIQQGNYPVWRFFTADFHLQRCTPLPVTPPYVMMKADEYRYVPFPLDDREWRELLAQTRL
ncbi:MAG: hypothetical protein KF897_11435 [Opitutaceae bacterium]|nr:hypothetical protein [Opitutaceae bacterium]